MPVSTAVVEAVTGHADPGSALHAVGLARCPDWPHAGTVDAFRPWIGGPPDAVLLGTLAGVVIGECGWTAPLDAQGTVEISFGLAPSHRGKGLGRDLVHALLSWSRERGATGVRAEVLPANDRSLRVLEGCGFALQERRAGHLVLARDVTRATR